MKMNKINTVKIGKKNIAVGFGKAMGMATIGYLSTAVLYSVFGEKTFGEIIIDSLGPGPVRKTVALGCLALSTYGYAGEDAVKDWLNEQPVEII